jgi:hypothetical protein
MSKMELVILKDVLKELALRQTAGDYGTGYLMGRRTGPSLFVEKVFLLPWKKLLQPEIFFQVEKKMGREILGVVSLKPLPHLKARLLQPLFAEKIFLQVQPGLKFRASVIKFDHRFFYQSLSRIILETEEENG